MRFAVSAAALVALASSALAQTAGFDVITSPTKDEKVPAGSTFDIVWQPNASYTGAVTITLLGGADPGHLAAVSTLSSTVESSAGKYAWAVAPSLGADATYGLQITWNKDKSVFQYSFPFHIVGGSNSTGATTSSTSGSPTSTPPPGNSTTSYSTLTTATPPGNRSTPTTSRTVVTLTSTGGGSGSSSSSKTSTPSSTVPTAAAATAAAGSMAMLGGLAMVAMFAL